MTTETAPEEPKFGPAELGALAHLYRGEMYRSKIWRTRLDSTTNWAVVTTGIALSVSFATIQATVLPIVLVSFLVTVFWILEARRYRYFDIWRTRVRVMETQFYGPILRGKGMRIDDRWNEILAQDYDHLVFHISNAEALGRRLRRNYGWIFGVQVLSYLGKISIHPTHLISWAEFWQRTAIGPLPGPLVVAIGLAFYAGLVVFGTVTLFNQQAVGRAHDHGRVDRIHDLAADQQP